MCLNGKIGKFIIGWVKGVNREFLYGFSLEGRKRCIVADYERYREGGSRYRGVC